MKKTTRISIIAGLLVIVILLAAFAPIVPISYDYPDPGTSEWNNMKREGDIPSRLVTPYHASRMTDWALIRTVADYPYLSVSPYGSMAEGIEAVTESYPCLQELEKRATRNPIGIGITMAAYIAWKCLTVDENDSSWEQIKAFQLLQVQVGMYAKIFGFIDDAELTHKVLLRYYEIFPFN